MSTPHQAKQTNASRTCQCRKPARGQMISCWNKMCNLKKFHIDCVNMKEKLPQWVRWYCPLCRPRYRDVANQWNYVDNCAPQLHRWFHEKPSAPSVQRTTSRKRKQGEEAEEQQVKADETTVDAEEKENGTAGASGRKRQRPAKKLAKKTSHKEDTVATDKNTVASIETVVTDDGTVASIVESTVASIVEGTVASIDKDTVVSIDTVAVLNEVVTN